MNELGLMQMFDDCEHLFHQNHDDAFFDGFICRLFHLVADIQYGSMFREL